MTVMFDQLCVYAKVYGERNTGTNFVTELLRRNFAVHCLQSYNRIHEYVGPMAKNLPGEPAGGLRNALLDFDCQRTMYSDFGWKHGIPPRDLVASAPHAKQTLFVCIAKHPVAWLHSLASRPYNLVDEVPKTFSRFIRQDWTPTWRDNMAACEPINVVDLWNVKNAAFRDLESVAQRCLVVAYEEILRDPAGFLSSAGSHLIARGKDYVWSFPSTKGDAMTFEQYRRKYLEQNICGSTSTGDLEFIRGRIDETVMRGFGYRWPDAGSG
ncbi:MAG TPA: hypothetical protein VMF67_03600 [Rhizomicrobium sp.]|nr:hypothetical protein [Rhizomicrobium sp.]